MRKMALEKKLRKFDLFCLLNSCGVGGGCDIRTIYYLLLSADDEDLDIPRPNNNAPNPHWVLYLNNTHYGVTISFYFPYFYSVSNSWRRFQLATCMWAERIASWCKEDWAKFEKKFDWCHPFPLTLAFLTAQTWKIVKGNGIEIKQVTLSNPEESKLKAIDGITMVALVRNEDDVSYFTIQRRLSWIHSADKMTFLEIRGANHKELAWWLATTFLLTADNLLHQLPGRKSKSKKKNGAPSP